MPKVPPPPSGSSAFTLVEIMIVVVIIGLLATIALPAFNRVRDQTTISRYANDVRQFAYVFETFALENGAWPADANPGEIPAGMDGLLPPAWSKPSMVGGVWEWDGEPSIKMITSYQPTKGVAFMRRIDAFLDDGHTTSGKYRRNGTEWNYILEESP